MSIFNSLFGNSEESSSTNNNIDWIPLTKVAQLDEIVEISEEKPTAIFKHSTRCSISRMVLKQLEREFDIKEKMDTYFLDLLAHRDISDAIAQRFDIRHESPQLLLIKNGKVVYHVSHSDITVDDLREKI